MYYGKTFRWQISWLVKNWVGSKMAGMKTTFFAIFDSTWTHIIIIKGPSKEFFKQHFS